MKWKVSKLKKKTFEIQIIQRQPPGVPQKKAALKNSTIPTVKHLHRDLSAINSQILRVQLYQKETPKEAPPPRVYYEIPKNNDSEAHLRMATPDN